jgi:superfamily I DNA/RNA helicase
LRATARGCCSSASTSSSRLQPAARGFRVVHFHGLCHELCEQAGVLAESVPDGPDAQEFCREEARRRMIDALGRLPARRCDAVIVDEGQDFSPRMWEALVALLADPAGGHLWMFCDPEQNIYDGELPSHLNLTPFKLTVNCRNTQPIARFACAAVDAEPRLRPSAPASPEVTAVAYATEAELVACVQRAIESLTSPGGLPPDRIVVLSPRGVTKSAVWAHRRFGRFTLERFGEAAQSAPADSGAGHTPRPRDVRAAAASTIRFSTLQGFKGLEADAVILCEVSPTTAPRAVYVAASRAKHVLWCVAETEKGTVPLS